MNKRSMCVYALLLSSFCVAGNTAYVMVRNYYPVRTIITATPVTYYHRPVTFAYYPVVSIAPPPRYYPNFYAPAPTVCTHGYYNQMGYWIAPGCY